MKTVEAARGKWSKILASYGIDRSYLDNRHHPCPCTGEGEDRFRFTDREGSGSYFCACSDGRKGGIALLECKTGKQFRELAGEIDAFLGNAHEVEKREVTYAERLRDVAKPSQRSAYLASRGLEVAPGLRFATGIEYRDDGKLIGTYAAMLAPITRSGRFETFHVTYLDRGKKADVKCPRKVLPGGQIVGSGIELYPAAEVMGVAEGIETAIAAKMLTGIPTHAAINTSLMAKWEPPTIAKRVTIFGDNDESFAGHAAAWALAHRLAVRGIETTVCMPVQRGWDWNDALLSQKEAA
jgi:putative DNA primase/helicase